MNERPPLVIHLGYERTSTTMHQMHVFANHETIHYFGKPFASPELRSAFNELACNDTVHYDAAHCRKALLAALPSADGQRALCSILSDEVMLSPQAVDLDLLLNRLQSVFGDFKALLTIRKQSDLFRSWCEHVLFKDEYGPLETIAKYQMKFRSRPDSILNFMDYYKYYDFLSERLGKDRVLVLPYELLRTDPKRYASMLAGFLGASEDLIIRRINSSPRENSRRGITDIAYYDFKKRHLSPRRQRYLDAAGRRLFRYLPINRHKVERMMGELQKSIADEFAAKNAPLHRALIETMSIDIAKLGYSLPPGRALAESTTEL